MSIIAGVLHTTMTQVMPYTDFPVAQALSVRLPFDIEEFLALSLSPIGIFPYRYLSFNVNNCDCTYRVEALKVASTFVLSCLERPYPGNSSELVQSLHLHLFLVTSGPRPVRLASHSDTRRLALFD